MSYDFGNLSCVFGTTFLIYGQWALSIQNSKLAERYWRGIIKRRCKRKEPCIWQRVLLLMQGSLCRCLENGAFFLFRLTMLAISKLPFLYGCIDYTTFISPNANQQLTGWLHHFPHFPHIHKFRSGDAACATALSFSAARIVPCIWTAARTTAAAASSAGGSCKGNSFDDARVFQEFQFSAYISRCRVKLRRQHECRAGVSVF